MNSKEKSYLLLPIQFFSKKLIWQAVTQCYSEAEPSWWHRPVISAPKEDNLGRSHSGPAWATVSSGTAKGTY